MISHRYRCIYVKQPKCAGTSVLHWFIAHGGGRHSFRPYWYRGTLPERIPRVAHLLDLYPGYFTFTFLRNPYRRFLSLYRHASRHAAIRAARIPGHPAGNGTLREFAELCAELLADTGDLWGAHAGAFFRDQAERRYGPLGIRLRHLEFVFNHVRPQTHFLPDCNPERLFGLKRRSPGPLHFIGAVETIDTDFRRIREALGLPRLPLPRQNASGGTPPGYDDATRRLVEELYAADFAFTGCGSMDAPAAPPCSGGVPGQPVSPERPGATALLPRAACTLASLEMSLEHRLFYNPRLRRRLAPLARRLRRLA